MADNTHAEASGRPTERETSIFKRVLGWLLETTTEAEDLEKSAPEEPTEDQTILKYTDALAKSIQSIHADDTMSDRQKVEMLQKSFDQFNAAVDKVGDREEEGEEPEDDP